ncbi:alpha/beta fold hydrolase [Bradyrhizobium cosmicum]|nr:alpha/beta fold hydrolase [Bradyrhizobium cosmicum]
MWLRKPRNAATIVFVHGLFSSNETAWLHPDGSFWPKLVCDEPQLGDFGVYLFSYRADIHAGTFSLENAVDAMRERFRLDGLFDNGSVGAGLIFVCHSMGGILARRFVVAQQLTLVDRKLPIGLFLIASPSLGSEYANFVSAIAPFYNAQIDILRFSEENQWLSALDKDFINIKEGDRLPIFGKELIEDNFIGSDRFFRRKQIVQRFSGARYFGEPVKIERTDHFTIAKPASLQAIQHRLLVEFATTIAKKYRIGPSDTENSTLIEGDNPVLVDWSSFSAQKPSNVSRKLFSRETVYEYRLSAAALCLLPLLLAGASSYLKLARERAAEAEILSSRFSSPSIRGAASSIFSFSSAEKVIEYSSTGSMLESLPNAFKDMGPIAISIKKARSSPFLLQKEEPAYQLIPGLGAPSNIVGIEITNADGLNDLDPLGTMPHLEAFIIGKPKFASSLHFLTRMPNLKFLYITDADIPDLEPIAALSELRQLFLSDLPRVTDLKPLKGLSKLECVQLLRLPLLKNAEVLLGLPNLKSVSIRESGVPVPPELKVKDTYCASPSRTEYSLP